MKRRTTVSLMFLFFLAWGIQFLVGNFMPIYVASLPYADVETVGLITALGSVVTMGAQFVWTRIADKSKSKSRVLALNLVLVALTSVLYLTGYMPLWLLLITTVVFYANYMVHQPLMDTIAAEGAPVTGRPFSWFRSFASLGYSCIGLLFTLVPGGSANSFFWYVLLLALATAAIALFAPPARAELPKQEAQAEPAAPEGSIWNRRFILFLVYSFLLFLCSSMTTNFLPVYYTAKDGIGGTSEVYSLLITIGTFIEWGVMLLFQKIFGKAKFPLLFLLLSLTGVARSVIVYLISDPLLVTSTILFHGLHYGIMWSTCTPYMIDILPRGCITRAQGIWTVVTFGIAAFVGSLTAGKMGAALGLREVFLLITGVYVLMCLLNPVFFPKKR